jgi:hypothetical protein
MQQTGMIFKVPFGNELDYIGIDAYFLCLMPHTLKAGSSKK